MTALGMTFFSRCGKICRLSGLSFPDGGRFPDQSQSDGFFVVHCGRVRNEVGLSKIV